MAKERESNMELLRIVAMLLVLIVHVDFAALGFPTHEEAVTMTGTTIWRYLFEGLALVCVNVFVLLSGWFGIRASKKGFFKFVTEVLFFGIVCLVFSICMGVESSAIGTAPTMWLRIRNTLIFTSPLYWFVISYMGLYILSPVLNSFIEKASQKELGLTLLFFMLFQTVIGWLVSSDPERGQFASGYSILSFIGLYLLARYVKLYPGKLTTKGKIHDLGLYLALCLLNASIGFAACYFDINGVNSRIVAYTNPLVIFASLYLLLFFSKLQIKSKVINWIGAGAFGVFLLHLNENIYFPYFKPAIQSAWANYDGLVCFGCLVGYVFVFFVAGVLLSKSKQGIDKLINKLSNK